MSRWSRNRQNPIFADLLNEFVAFYGNRNVLMSPDEPTTRLVRATLVLLSHALRFTLKRYKRIIPLITLMHAPCIFIMMYCDQQNTIN